MNSYEYVNVEIKDKVGVIEFNYLKKLNSLSECFIKDILKALEDLNVDEIRCIILQAPKGSKVFSAGHVMCQHFSGHVVKQQFAAVRN